MNHFIKTILISLIAFTGFSADKVLPPPNMPKLDIRFLHKGFETDPENFVVVCNSAAMTVARFFPKRDFKPILILNTDSPAPPARKPEDDDQDGRIAPPTRDFHVLAWRIVALIADLTILPVLILLFYKPKKKAS